MNLPDIDVVIQAIGQDTSSAPLCRLLRELEIGEADFRHYPFKLTGRRLWTDEDNVLQLEFKDIGLLADIPGHTPDDGPWVLTNAAFWGARKNKRAYSGRLPWELEFSMHRQHVRERLAALNSGKAIEGGLSGEVDIWRVNGVDLAVDFSGPDDSIRCVAIAAPLDRGDDPT